MAIARKAGETLSPEEEALLSLLEKLVKDYDDKIELPKISPRDLIQLLMNEDPLVALRYK
jgi:hypothetical protein